MFELRALKIVSFLTIFILKRIFSAARRVGEIFSPGSAKSKIKTLAGCYLISNSVITSVTGHDAFAWLRRRKER